LLAASSPARNRLILWFHLDDDSSAIAIVAVSASSADRIPTHNGTASCLFTYSAVVLPFCEEPAGWLSTFARRTGGLADSIEDGFTGFLFRAVSVEGCLEAVGRALDVFGNTDLWGYAPACHGAQLQLVEVGGNLPGGLWAGHRGLPEPARRIAAERTQFREPRALTSVDFPWGATSAMLTGQIACRQVTTVRCAGRNS
jgi:hypothetical protein